ncbi:UNVERIFIED_CONTAM: hypothetical protein FKN15_037183 [Acipenser sinensis]
MNLPAAVAVRRMPAKCQDRVRKEGAGDPVRDEAILWQPLQGCKPLHLHQPLNLIKPLLHLHQPLHLIQLLLHLRQPLLQRQRQHHLALEAGKDGTVWNTIHPGVDAAGTRAVLLLPGA